MKLLHNIHTGRFLKIRTLDEMSPSRAPFVTNVSINGRHMPFAYKSDNEVEQKVPGLISFLLRSANRETVHYHAP